VSAAGRSVFRQWRATVAASAAAGAGAVVVAAVAAVYANG